MAVSTTIARRNRLRRARMGDVLPITCNGCGWCVSVDRVHPGAANVRGLVLAGHTCPGLGG